MPSLTVKCASTSDAPSVKTIAIRWLEQLLLLAGEEVQGVQAGDLFSRVAADGLEARVPADEAALGGQQIEDAGQALDGRFRERPRLRLGQLRPPPPRVRRHRVQREGDVGRHLGDEALQIRVGEEVRLRGGQHHEAGDLAVALERHRGGGAQVVGLGQRLHVTESRIGLDIAARSQPSAAQRAADQAVLDRRVVQVDPDRGRRLLRPRRTWRRRSRCSTRDPAGRSTPARVHRARPRRG